MGAARGHGLSRQAVFFLAHEWRPSLALRFARLHREVQGVADCLALVQRGAGDVPSKWSRALRKLGLEHALRVFDTPALPALLGYPFFGDGNVMGNSHFPVLLEARAGDWDHVWKIESDVDLRGNWGDLLRAFGASEADLLVSHKQHRAQWPLWRWWRSLRAPAGVDLGGVALFKGFFPFARFSAAALRAIEDAHRAGWSGHYEVLVPTVLVRAGLAVEDLRSVVHCYDGQGQNPSRDAAALATLRWRPHVKADEFAGRGTGALIFHPVKEDWAFDGRRVRAWPGAFALCDVGARGFAAD